MNAAQAEKKQTNSTSEDVSENSAADTPLKRPKDARREAPLSTEFTPLASSEKTVVGWQGLRFVLPPEWNVAGFSMDRDNGYLRVDSPGSGTMTIQLRWMNVAKPQDKTVYTLLSPHFRRLLRRPEPPVPEPNLRTNLEKILKETAKQAKKSKTEFKSDIKPEKTEGEDDERTAMNFAWSGDGRGQGKAWYCKTCHRLVIAQVVGMAKERDAISAITSQLLGSLQCHAPDGFDRWALYDLQCDVPEDFRLVSQKLLSGYLHLEFMRGAERIVVDRWGLANMTLKRFTLDEWFQNNALLNLKKLAHDEVESERGHTVSRFSGRLPLFGKLRALREAKGSLRRFPSGYVGGIWECENRIYAVQVFHHRSADTLFDEVIGRCVCH
jgi:hypothetical protein